MVSFAAFRGLFAARRANDPARVFDRAIKDGRLRNGPPAIAAARAQFGDRPDIFIAPLETRFGMIGDRIAVKAWILVSETDKAPDLTEVTQRSAKAFDGDCRMADVFFLSASYGIPTGDIAILLGITRREVRRLLVGAIARIDRHFGDHRPTSASHDPESPIP